MADKRPLLWSGSRTAELTSADRLWAPGTSLFTGVATFTVAPVFTDAAGTRTALGLGTGDNVTFFNLNVTGAGITTTAVLFTPGAAPGALVNGYQWYDSGAANMRAYVGGATRDLWHSGNLLNIGTSASTARTALALGTAATENTGTSGATLPFCNGAITWGSNWTFSVTNWTIAADTADASDTKSMSIAGGGTTAAGRGGSVIVYGNEHATYPGRVRITAGNASSIISHVGDLQPETTNTYTAGTSSLRYSNVYTTLLNVSAAATFGATGTFGSTLSVNRVGAAGAGIMAIDVDTGQNARVILYTGGVLRWDFAKNSTAESGSNAGSDFYLRAYSDAGTSLGDVFTVVRATRVITIYASMDFNSQQALNFRLENRTSDPGSPTAGQIWLRTDL